MRIAFYAPLKPLDHPTPSGDRAMARLLFTALTLAGHDPIIISRLRSFEPQGQQARQQEILRDAEHEVSRILDDIARLAIPKPDAWFTYHLYYKAPDLLGPQVAQALDIPYLVAEASHASKRANGPWALFHAHTERAIHAANCHFCLTELDRVCLEPLVSAQKIITLSPFTDTASFQVLPERATLRQRIAVEHNIDSKKPWLLSVGMLRPGDKLESYRRLAKALQLIKEPAWQLLIVGNGEAEREVRIAFTEFGDRISFLGTSDATALPAIYAACDLYVWPAANEAYGMALLEAQAAGLPVIAGRVRGVPNVVRDGITAILTTDNDATAFSAAIKELLQNPQRRQSMSQAARNFVLKERNLAQAAATLDRALRLGGNT